MMIQSFFKSLSWAYVSSLPVLEIDLVDLLLQLLRTAKGFSGSYHCLFARREKDHSLAVGDSRRVATGGC